MVKQAAIAIVSLALMLGMASCSVFVSKPEQYTQRLMRHSWVVNTYVDNSLNEVLDMPNIVYTFEENGVLKKTYENGEQYTAEWRFVGDAEYIVIGNNTFRLNTLTNKVMGLSYGEIDLFFVPAQ